MSENWRRPGLGPSLLKPTYLEQSFARGDVWVRWKVVHSIKRAKSREDIRVKRVISQVMHAAVQFALVLPPRNWDIVLRGPALQPRKLVLERRHEVVILSIEGNWPVVIADAEI